MPPLDSVGGTPRIPVVIAANEIRVSRVCPGRYMGSDTLFIIMTSVLAVFEITKAIDENGEVIESPARHIAELVDL